MSDGGSFSVGGAPSKHGKIPGIGGPEAVKKRAAATFDELEAEEELQQTTAKPAGDTADLRNRAGGSEPTPGDLVKKVQALKEGGGDRGFAITRGPDGRTIVRVSGNIDPSVFADQKLPVPRQQLRAYAQSTQQWLLMTKAFEASVVDFQALLATKVRHGQISRAEAQEALRAHFPTGSPDSGPPILRFLAANPQYKDLFGILAEP